MEYIYRITFSQALLFAFSLWFGNDGFSLQQKNEYETKNNVDGYI